MKTKAPVILLLLGLLNFSGLGVVIETLAYYNDTETSSGNAHIAGSLDFALTETSYEDTIRSAETVSFSSILLNSGTLDWQYTLEAEKISGDDDFCSALNLEAELNGSEKHDNSLLALDVPASSTLGTWTFDITLPVNATGVAHGDTCKVDFVYKGWQTEIPLYEDSGFTDEERVSVTLTARMIVLNEFLPRPDGVAYSFDFGDDSSDMPRGEWVELYNNSTESVDVAGWYTRDSTDGAGNKVVITALNTSPDTTIIGGKSWLVVYMNKPILNNTGDTVRLFDDADNLIDSHSYDDPDFCEIEPTPGDENSTDASGSCSSVPPNKSYARIPDGIGEWVDPIPTPGGVNRLGEMEEVIVTENTGSSQASVPADENTDPISEFIAEVIEFFNGGNEEIIAPVSEEEIIITPEETVVTEEPAEENITEPEAVIQNEEQPIMEPEPAEEAVEPPQEEPTPEPTI